jgi:hypothetical protein
MRNTKDLSTVPISRSVTVEVMHLSNGSALGQPSEANRRVPHKRQMQSCLALH